MRNTVSLMGRITAKPELRHTPSNVAVTNVTLAVSRAYVKQGEERQTDFIEVIAWRNTAEFLSKYFDKGDPVVITGVLQTRTYTDKEGKNRKMTEVVAEKVFFVPANKTKDSNSTEESNDEFISLENEDLPF